MRYRLRAVERMRLGTTYQDIAAHIAGRQQQAAAYGPVVAVFGETGNRAAGDLIRELVPGAVACILTGSEQDQPIAPRRWSVSKANMVTALLAALESRDLELAGDLTDLAGLKSHLVDLRRRISAIGHMTFNAREGGHDDYVTACGLALWWAARPRGVRRAIRVVGG